MNSYRLVNIFKEVAGIDSVTGEEQKLVEWLVDYLEGNKLVDEVRVDGFGNVYARLDGDKEFDPLFFAAHLDTVEPGRGIKAVVKDKCLVSEGETILGADNKAALASILEFLYEVKENQVNHGLIEFIFTLSEEVGNYGAINFDYSLLSAKRGFCFDSSNPVGTIVSGSPYYERYDLRIVGKAAHAGKPEEGINVLIMFNKILSSVRLGRIDEETIHNMGVIEAGEVRNTVPGQILVQGEVRGFDEGKLVAFKNEFIEVVNTEVKQCGGEVDFDFVRENPGYKFGKNSQVISFLKNKIKGVGLVPVLKQPWGVSDANIFNDRGLVCVNLGDGSEFSHTVDERIAVDELENMVKVMLNLVKVAEVNGGE